MLQYSGVDIEDQKGTLGTQTGLWLVQSKPSHFKVAKKPFVCVCACFSWFSAASSLPGALGPFWALMWVVAGACGILLCYIRGCCLGCHVECQRHGWPFRRYTSELEVSLSTDSVLFLLVPHRNLLCFFQKGQFLAQHGRLSRIRRLTSCWPYCKMVVLVWARWYCPL